MLKEADSSYTLYKLRRVMCVLTCKNFSSLVFLTLNVRVVFNSEKKLNKIALKLALKKIARVFDDLVPQ